MRAADDHDHGCATHYFADGPCTCEYRWKVGDVFTNGPYRWKVVTVQGDRAWLQSCTTDWAKTIGLTYAEWNADGKWTLEAQS